MHSVFLLVEEGYTDVTDSHAFHQKLHVHVSARMLNYCVFLISLNYLYFFLFSFCIKSSNV